MVLLLRLLADVDPAAALHAAIDATTGDDAVVQREALRHLEGAAFSPEIARGLHHLVESRHEPVRLAALPVMAARGGPRVFAALRAHVEKHAARLSAAEAEAAGQALARASGPAALETFGEWLRPKGRGPARASSSRCRRRRPSSASPSRGSAASRAPRPTGSSSCSPTTARRACGRTRRPRSRPGAGGGSRG